MIKIPCILLIASVFLTGCQPEPTTYEDCVLQKINQNTDKIVAKLVRDTCSDKFRPTAPVEMPAVFEIPAASLSSISLTAYLDDKPQAMDIHTNNIVEQQRTHLVGSVYNGLRDWQITSLEVAVGFGNDIQNYKLYAIDDLYLLPFKMKNIKLTVENKRYNISGQEYSWAIGRAYGFKLNEGEP